MKWLGHEALLFETPRSSGRSWSESDRGRGGKATSDRMVNERFLCNDRGWQPAVIAQPPEDTIDKGSV